MLHMPALSPSVRQQNFPRILRMAAISGSVASMVSALVAAACGHVENGKPAGPINAISHWVWDEKAFRYDAPSLRHTLVGYLVHHAMSIFWATAFESLMKRHPEPTPRSAVQRGLAVAAVACIVDYTCTPERLTPGFEHKISKKSLLCIYSSFGLGLAVAYIAVRRGG